MKKKIVLIVSAFFLIFICSATVFATNNGITGFSDFFNKNLTIQKDEKILATVNGEKLYKSDVDFQCEFSDLSYTLAAKQLDRMNIPEAQKQDLLKQQRDSQKTEAEILDDLIKETVILQEAKRQGISISDEEARAFALEQYTLLKELALTSEPSSPNRINYEFIKQYMEKMDLTEEEYIDKATIEYKKLLILNKFYESAAITNRISNQNNMDNYTETLLRQAEIVYME